MSDVLQSHLEFTNIYGIEHELGVTPDWKVQFDGQVVDRLKPVAAVMITGLISLVNTVQTRAIIYDTARNQYELALEEFGASEIPEMSAESSGFDPGKQLGVVMNVGYSPLQTNVLSLKIGVKDKIIIASNTQDEKSIWDIINATTIVDRPEGNILLQGDLHRAFDRRRSFLLRNVSRGAKSGDKQTVRRGSKASPETIARLSQGIVEVPTSVTRRRSHASPPSRKQEVTPIVREISNGLHVPKPNSPKNLEELTLPTYLSSELVVREVGNLIFGATEGDNLTAKELVKLLKVKPSDEQKVNNVLVAMSNAGYLDLSTREDAFKFKKTGKQKPESKSS